MRLRLPDSPHAAAKRLAERDGISINQLVATALAEKMAALATLDLLEARAQLGSRKKFRAALARLPDVEPEPWDRLPHGFHRDPNSRGASRSHSRKASSGRRQSTSGRRVAAKRSGHAGR